MWRRPAEETACSEKKKAEKHKAEYTSLQDIPFFRDRQPEALDPISCGPQTSHVIWAILICEPKNPGVQIFVLDTDQDSVQMQMEGNKLQKYKLKNFYEGSVNSIW